MERKILSSWKEIADYLKIHVKTAQRQDGLPVHRMSDKPGGRVVAFQDELDDWIRSRAVRANGVQKERARRVWPIVIGGLLAMAALFVLFLKISDGARPSAGDQPADFQVVGSELVVLNHRKGEIGRFDTRLSNLEEEAFFRNRFQSKKYDNQSRNPVSNIPPLLLFHDVDGDGPKEVLFAPVTRTEFDSRSLYCLNANGEPIWKADVGRDLVFGTERFQKDYVIKEIGAEDLDGDGRSEIIVISSFRMRYPTQVLVLDHQGKPAGEYWNSGQINDMDFTDINGDGRKEICLGGQNNEYAKPCIIILEAGEMKGASPQEAGNFKCPELGRGSEKYYILLPISVLDRIWGKGAAVSWIDARDRTVSCWTNISGIQYEFDGQMLLMSLLMSHTFRNGVEAAVREGALRGPTDFTREEASLRAGIRYYNGKGWVPGAAMSNPW